MNGTIGTTDRERFDHWQNAAIDAWENAGRSGIVEAVTGSGKTHVAFKLIRRLSKTFGNKLYPLIVVPTIPLMDQWKIGLEKVFDGEPVGLQGGGHKDTFATFRNDRPVRAIVSTIHSAVTALDDGLLQHCGLPGGGHSLLIADECHHLLSKTALLYPRVLENHFDFKIGLSPMVGRYDIRKLGRIVYEYNLRTAVTEGVIPPFDIVNVGVQLGPSEVQAYLQLEQEVARTLATVLQMYNLRSVWNESLWVELQRLARWGNDPLVCKLFGLIFKKAELVYTAEQKIKLAPAMIRQLVANGRKVLVFFERIRSVETVMSATSPDQMAMATARALREGDEPVACHIYHSQLSKPERRKTLDKFRVSGPGVLLTCRALNEGLDVPTVDAAVIVAATQSRRPMIQRIGRTLRQEAGKHRPVILILHAKGTNDDRVRVDPADPYFAGPARVFETPADEMMPFLSGLLRMGEPHETWRCVFDREKDFKIELVPLLGELCEVLRVKVELTKNRCLVGRIQGVTQRPPRFSLDDKMYCVQDVRRVFNLKSPSDTSTTSM